MKARSNDVAEGRYQYFPDHGAGSFLYLARVANGGAYARSMPRAGGRSVSFVSGQGREADGLPRAGMSALCRHESSVSRPLSAA